MTLTSEISPTLYGNDPQAWLDSIPLPSAEEVKVRFEDVAGQDVFYRRCFLKVEVEGVGGVVAITRARGVEGEKEVGEKTRRWLDWWVAAYGPHVSLMYGGVEMDEGKMDEVRKVVEDAGINLQRGAEAGEGSGWDGGVVWLVPTDRDIKEWKSIAVREL